MSNKHDNVIDEPKYVFTKQCIDDICQEYGSVIAHMKVNDYRKNIESLFKLHGIIGKAKLYADNDFISPKSITMVEEMCEGLRELLTDQMNKPKLTKPKLTKSKDNDESTDSEE